MSSDGSVSAKQLWVLSESQETVGVGPELFEELIKRGEKVETDTRKKLKKLGLAARTLCIRPCD